MKVTLQQCENNQKKLLLDLKDKMLPAIRKIAEERKLNGISMENEYQEEIIKYELQIFDARYQGYELLKKNLNNPEPTIKEAKQEVAELEKQRDEFKAMYKQLLERASLEEVIEVVKKYKKEVGIKPTVITMSTAYSNEISGKAIDKAKTGILEGMKVVIDDGVKFGFSVGNEYKQEKL